MKIIWPRPQFITLIITIAIVTFVAITFNLYHYSTLTALARTNPIGTANLADISAFSSFSGALAWVKSAGYSLMFLAMVVEGPIVTSAAAFAAALGYFNIFIIFLLSVAGDLVGDFIYYGIGYFGRVRYVEKYGHRIGLTERRMKRMEHLIKTHPKKTLAAIKLAPILPAPGLMMIGASRMPFGRYAWMTLLVALPKTILFMALGYYFGNAYDRFATVFQNGEYFLMIAIALTVIIFYAYQQLSAKLSTRLEIV
jgi:membrane protein DedA with SNARE-associated domain